MAEDNITIVDTIEKYGALMGLETRDPLVAVVDMGQADPEAARRERTWNYGFYSLWLKGAHCGDLTYGRQPYDYQEGTVTSFAPGQVVRFKPAPGYRPDARGLLFHPDLIRGTSLGQGIKRYRFFSYSSREALHLGEEEKALFLDCLRKVEAEIERPRDRHSRRLVCRNIELLLDYCQRFYDRQFTTREVANRDVLEKFEALLDDYFAGDRPYSEGLPSVRYFAGRCFLSPNYFGDLVKKETGKTPQEYIQEKVIELAKELLLRGDKSVSEVAYRLGFQYSQHFNRYFKKRVGLTPSQYRARS